MIEAKIKDKKFWKKIVIITILIFILILVIIFNFFLEFKKVDGDSMFPTLNSKDIVLIRKLHKEIKYNDIIVFYYNGIQLIKRVIAFEGDTVEFNQCQLSVNNKHVANFENESIESCRIIIAKNECFVIGDNYNESYDSRNFGPIKKDEILGVVVKILK